MLYQPVSSQPKARPLPYVDLLAKPDPGRERAEVPGGFRTKCVGAGVNFSESGKPGGGLDSKTAG